VGLRAAQCIGTLAFIPVFHNDGFHCDYRSQERAKPSSHHQPRYDEPYTKSGQLARLTEELSRLCQGIGKMDALHQKYPAVEPHTPAIIAGVLLLWGDLAI